MKKQLLLLCMLITTLLAQSQELNKLDDKGKKHGKHVRYLDKLWNVVEDSTKAVYFRYTFYDHGVNVHPMGAGGGNKLWKMKSTIDTSKQVGIKILDGEYKWLDPKGRMIFWHCLKNGEYVWYKEYYETGELQSFFDYTKHAEGQPWSWYMIVYNKDGSIKLEEYTKKDSKGNWPTMRG
jgi:hypothetical protein